MDSNTTSISGIAASATSASTVTIASSAAAKTVASTAAVNKSSSTTTAPATPKQNTELQRDPRSLQFQVEGNRVVTTIVDENNNTVVVQIPDADMIQLAKAIDRMQGFLVQEKA